MITINSKNFEKEMNNLVQYSLGYIEGINRGKRNFLKNLGENVLEVLKNYIDTNARVNPEVLHHVYEWNQTGSPDARLFDIEYTVSNLGLSLKSTFRQSTSIKDGSREPFYDKARIMEQGIPVVIRPKNAKVLSFEGQDGEQVFTKNPVEVLNPGGDATTGGFEQVFDSFFSRYFSQAFLLTSGILEYIQNPTVYKKNLQRGMRQGRSTGIDTGYRWIVNAGVIK